MHLQTYSETGKRRLLTSGNCHYEHLLDAELPQVPEEVERVRAVFRAMGYESIDCPPEPSNTELKVALSDGRKGCVSGDLLVAYYSGHGTRDGERFYLLTHNSKPSELDDTALSAEDFARTLVKGSLASQVLIILDTCYSGAGAADIGKLVSNLAVTVGGDGPAVFVIAASSTKQQAEQGALSIALCNALENRDEQLGGRLQRYLQIGSVMGAVAEHLETRFSRQTPIWQSINVRGDCRLFPNPRYRAELSPGLDLESQTAFEEDWILKARGTELGIAGRYFTGRAAVIREISAWLQQADSGGSARVVTGSAGCGKSAILARVVTLLSPRHRRAALENSLSGAVDPEILPLEGIVDVALHLRRKLLAEVVRAIARQLSVSAHDSLGLIDAIARRDSKTVIILDALDEADQPDEIVSQLLFSLAGMPKVFLLVGTRPDGTQRGRRFSKLGASAYEIDLDLPIYEGADDIALYSQRRLLATEERNRATPYKDCRDVAEKIGAAIAARAKGNFLVAHATVTWLLSRNEPINVTAPGWSDNLPNGLGEALSRFLLEIDIHKPGGLTSSMARAALLPLAFAEGEGLPWQDEWAPVASALSGIEIHAGHIVQVRRFAAAFIVEGLDSDCSVYRIFHELAAEYLRSTVDQTVAHQIITDTLYSRVPLCSKTNTPDWSRASAYTRTHYATHAVKAGQLQRLNFDGAYFAAAEPVRLLEALQQSTTPILDRARSSYLSAFPSLTSKDTADRLSYLEMAARQQGSDLLANAWIYPDLRRGWSVPWAKWNTTTPNRVLQEARYTRSIALATFSGRTLVAAGTAFRTVCVWDLTTGKLWRGPFQGHTRTVNSIAFGEVRGRMTVISGGDEGIIRLWDLSGGMPSGDEIIAHEGAINSLAFGTLNGRPIVVSGGDDKFVRVWDLETQAKYGETKAGHDSFVNAVVFGVQDGRPVVVSGSNDGAVRRWDVLRPSSDYVTLCEHDGGVTSLVACVVNSRHVVVSSGRDETIRVTDLSTGDLYGDLMSGHSSTVNSLAVGMVGKRLTLVSGGNDRTLRLWDLQDTKPLGSVLRGHEMPINAVALGSDKGRPIVVSSGYDKTLRIWDISRNWSRELPSRGHRGAVNAVAIGDIGGTKVAASGGDDATVRVWNLATGEAFGVPLRGHKDAVLTISFVKLERKTLVASWGRDGCMRLWDPIRGAPFGIPIPFHDGEVTSAATETVNGMLLIAAGGEDGIVRLWAAGTWTALGSSENAHRGKVTSIVFGCWNGRPAVISSGEDGRVRIWDPAGAQLGKALTVQEAPIHTLASCVSDGHLSLYVGCHWGAIRGWEIDWVEDFGPFKRDRELRSEDGSAHGDAVLSVAFGSISGKSVLVSGSSDRTVRVWDLMTLQYGAIDVATSVRALAVHGDNIVVAGDLGLTMLKIHHFGT